MTHARETHAPEPRPHLLVRGFANAERFVSPGSGRSIAVPHQNRRAHGRALRNQLRALPEQAAEEFEEADAEAGFPVEFIGFPDVALAFESLARERSGIELLNVRQVGGTTRATVFVPEGKLAIFERVVADYLANKHTAKGRSLDHRGLVDTIESIRVGSLQALWTDSLSVFPSDDNQPMWWEVWLSVRGRREAIIEEFQARALQLRIRIGRGRIEFPERTVILAFASPRQMKQTVGLLNLIAELRRAKETAEFFDTLEPAAQAEWINDLLARTRFADAAAPYVCLLDTGCNRGHPLLVPAVGEDDMHSVDPDWGVEDTAGHGTQMAALSLFGDLTGILAGQRPVQVPHRLESVKLLTADGENVGDPLHHGYLTLEAVSRPEIRAPDRQRVFAMAVSCADNRDRGRPSAWSAAIDSLAADADEEGLNPRLIVVCAGNTEPAYRANYPANNTTDSVHDPGQSWNALTAGASTDLVRITEPDAQHYQPVASQGDMSPFSTTSATWESQWPLKPDVMFEGGNAGRDGLGVYTIPSLSLLTAHHRVAERLFTTASETSASTALGAHMAARIMARYPGLRPETVRALIVHSAAWTPAMKRMFLPNNREPNKADFLQLIRHCGFGNPSLDRSLASYANSVSMVVEETLQPFARQGGKPPALNEMHLHQLPWPVAALQELGATRTQMRVTLSYFVEPNPSVRGRSRYSYQSHGLRFKVKRGDESLDGFRARVNKAAREDEGVDGGGDDQRWRIGSNNRHRGSIHSDFWDGTAAELAECGVLAVYPTVGWWKSRTALRQYERRAPYTLIVSIHTPPTDIDLYALVQAQIAVRAAVEV